MAAAPGWYPDAYESGRQRYFDGARWTDNYYYATTSAPMYPTRPADPTLEHPQPAGWYPDPHEQARRRYWDGQRWTNHYTDAEIMMSSDVPDDRQEGVPFVISLEGEMYMDMTGRVTDFQLAAGAQAVLGAGRWIVRDGRVMVITNESKAYHPSLSQMKATIKYLADMGADLGGDGDGVRVVVYTELDIRGRGKYGRRYRVRETADGFDLLPDF